MVVHVLLDGDNIQYEYYVRNIEELIKKQFGTDFLLTIYCQSNVIFKYKTSRDIKVNIKCSKTRNKNATDALMLYELGKLNTQEPEDTIVIVSNDRIFEEIADNKSIYQVASKIIQKKKLKEDNVKQILKQLEIEKENESDDILLEDLMNYLKTNSIGMLKEYILKKVKGVHVTDSDVVYFSE
tara:strand:- start:239 stop:787 length:549 start_codon:yes stop_codon:yes gene_type:complete